MNTEPNRPTPGGPDEEPVVIGSGLRDVEDRLRGSLAHEAQSITPSDRLGAILTDAHEAESGDSRPHRWLVPAVAAAAAVVVAGATVWAMNRPTASTPPAAAVSSTTSVQTPPTPPTSAPSSVPTQTATGPTTGPTGPTTGPTGLATSSPPQTLPPVTSSVSLPVYYAGPVVDGSTDVRLFREFVTAGVPSPVTAEGKALAALGLAMASQVPAGSSYVPVWSGVRPEAVGLTKAGILVTLSRGLGSQPPGGSALAVQQLVWTAQATVGQGPLQVRFVVPGGADVAPGMPSDRPYNRPSAANDVSAVLAPVWVNEPFRGQRLAAGSRPTVNGVASTFEANVQWQLLESGAEVESGSTTATAGAPQRGTYSFRTTTALAPGDYVIRVFETSAKDGSVAAEQRVPFTVG